MPINHGKATNLMLLHCRDGFVDRIVGTDRDRFLTAELTRANLCRILAGCYGADDDIAIGQHPLQAVIFTTDRHGAYIDLTEHWSSCRKTVVHADAFCSR